MPTTEQLASARDYIAANIDAICHELYCGENDLLGDLLHVARAMELLGDNSSDLLECMGLWSHMERIIGSIEPDCIGRGQRVHEAMAAATA